MILKLLIRTGTAYKKSPLYPITPLKGAPRLRTQCALKRGRAHAPLNRRKKGPFTMYLHEASSPFPRLFCLFPVISHFIVPSHKSAEVQYFEISRGTCPTTCPNVIVSLPILFFHP